MLTKRLFKLTVLTGLTACAISSFSAAAADQPATVKSTAARPLVAKEVWGHDFAQAKAQARKLNRPIVLHFHATWCGPCQQMERGVLNSAGVLKEINSRCVGVKVDSDQQPQLVQQYRVEALPCDVFVTAEGKVLKVSQGAVSAEQYTSMISQVAKPKAAAPIEVTSK